MIHIFAKLLSIEHEIHNIIDCNPPTDMRGTFLNIFKALDKVWHKDLVSRLKTYSIDCSILKLFENYSMIAKKELFYMAKLLYDKIFW